MLVAMNLDYFKDPPSFTQYPPNPHRRFVLSDMTPFGAVSILKSLDVRPATQHQSQRSMLCTVQHNTATNLRMRRTNLFGCA